MKRLALAIALLATPAVASAHIMPEGQGSAHLVGNRAYILLSVSAKALAAFDDDRDGLLSRAELGRHGNEIEAALERRVRFFVGDVPERVLWQTLSIEHSDSVDAPMASLTLVRVSEWDSTATRIRLVTDVFADRSSSIAFRTILDKREAVDTLTATRNEAEFFGPPRTRLRITAVDVAMALLVVAFGGAWFFGRQTTLTVNTASRSR